MEELRRLYSDFIGNPDIEMRQICQSGSHRQYFRLSAASCHHIGVIGTDADENKAFIGLARHFRSKGINVPEVLAVSGDGLRYIQEDLGEIQLYDLLADGRKSGEYDEDMCRLLCKTMAALPKIQFEGAEGLDFSLCYPEEEFSARMVDFDLNYFKYCYLKTSGVEFNEIKLQDDFDALKMDLLKEDRQTFMYRDFQARNVMMKDGEPWFIDFQGGRRGPIYYDVASFVWQARARYPEEVKERMISAYLDALGQYHSIDRDEFEDKLRIFVLFRTLQVLGAYGFRGKFEKKPHFLESIPYALANLRALLHKPFDRYPYLCDVLAELCAEHESPAAGSGLEVHVYSFSYRKGIPEDHSGNGGGYVFDCRGLHNPGRYEQYKNSTGMDDDVIKFLEERGEVSGYLESIYSIIDPHVARYIARGFSHLQISFGCTGGQHRSVYCAEATARHIHDKFGIKVRLTHVEQHKDISF